MLKIEPDESGLKARSLTVPHITLEDTILADEVQNVVNQRLFREGDQI